MSAKRPLVSVVIPAHNCERFIGQTIESVLGQSLNDLEVIVVDDGSVDGTGRLALRFGKPVRVVTQDNAGVCVARNRGIGEATGLYIALLDQDDYWFPEKLEQQVGLLEREAGFGVAYTSFMPWEVDAEGVYPAPLSMDRSRFGEGIEQAFSGWIYHQFLLDCWMLTSTAVFRKEAFEKCGTFDHLSHMGRTGICGSGCHANTGSSSFRVLALSTDNIRDRATERSETSTIERIFYGGRQTGGAYAAPMESVSRVGRFMGSSRSITWTLPSAMRVLETRPRH